MSCTAPFIRATCTMLMLAASLSHAQSASAPALPAAAQRMSEPGPEGRELAQQTGNWDVVSTNWPAPGAAPVETRGLVAERSLVGLFLQEVMRPAPGSKVPDFRRLDYLNYDRVEGRWKYVSMDTRLPVSIMPASSSGAARDGKVTLQFAPQAFVGLGPEVEGRFMVSDMVLSQPDANHLLKQQHVVMADGSGRSWLFQQYAYTRRR